MYSVVLATALVSGAGAEGHWGHRAYCYHAHACYGSYGCHVGYGCLGHRRICCGCYGGYGYGCYGGYSGCYYSGYGCYYGCYQPYGGWACYGCYGGCYSGCYSPYHPVPTAPVPGGAQPAPPKSTQPPGPGKQPQPKPGTDKKPGTPPKGTGKTSAPARLIVELPEDAKLYVDGHPTRSTSSRRVFQSPPLEPGKTYYYDLTAEVERDGQPIRVTGRVVIRAGEQVRATLAEPVQGASFVVRNESQ